LKKLELLANTLSLIVWIHSYIIIQIFTIFTARCYTECSYATLNCLCVWLSVTFRYYADHTWFEYFENRPIDSRLISLRFLLCRTPTFKRDKTGPRFLLWQTNRKSHKHGPHCIATGAE